MNNSNRSFIFCPRCGEKNLIGAKFCTHCGHSLVNIMTSLDCNNKVTT
ncbi:zinc-ribbon domain-containing protein [Lacticaseibacillus paracasei]|nr:zinc-ribbon domain-containing protein [Lacticaseibacillus paracasei]